MNKKIVKYLIVILLLILVMYIISMFSDGFFMLNTV